MFSPPKRNATVSLTGLGLILALASLILKAIGTLYVRRQIALLNEEYSEWACSLISLSGF